MATLLEQEVGTWRSEKKKEMSGERQKGEGAEEGRDATRGEGRKTRRSSRRRRQVMKRSTKCEERW